MPRRIKVVLGAIVAAIVLVVLMAASAFANTIPTVTLSIGPTAATYAHDVVITPSIVGTVTIPGDGITLQTWSSAESTWTAFGEGLKVEDTGTVCPQWVSVDETFLPWFYSGAWHPALFRAIFKPVSRGADTSGTAWPAPPSVTSNTASLSIVKVKTVKTKISFPKRVKHGHKGAFYAYTSPSVGIGTMRYTITRKGSRTVTVNATTDDAEGSTVAMLKFSKKGTYKVSARWLGNPFGAASSKAVSANVKIY